MSHRPGRILTSIELSQLAHALTDSDDDSVYDDDIADLSYQLDKKVNYEESDSDNSAEVSLENSKFPLCFFFLSCMMNIFHFSFK